MSRSELAARQHFNFVVTLRRENHLALFEGVEKGSAAALAALFPRAERANKAKQKISLCELRAQPPRHQTFLYSAK
jgi:hypothetical protein